MTERKENFTPDEWTIHEYDSSIVIRDGKNMVCRCSKNANGKKYARFIKTAPEMYDVLKRIVEMQKRNYGHGMDTHIELIKLAKEAAQILKKARGEE